MVLDAAREVTGIPKRPRPLLDDRLTQVNGDFGYLAAKLDLPGLVAGQVLVVQLPVILPSTASANAATDGYVFAYGAAFAE